MINKRFYVTVPVCHFEISLIINTIYKYYHGWTLKVQQSII